MGRPRDPNSYHRKLCSVLTRLLYEHSERVELPTSGRFLIYELKPTGLIRLFNQKTGGKLKRMDNAVNTALTELRKEGIVPWEWIIDETRDVDSYPGYATVLDGVISNLPYLGIHPWGAAKPPLIITESRSLAGVLRSVVAEYHAIITSTNGQCNGHLRTKVAPYINDCDRVLYFGDFNKAGTDIEDNTRMVLEEVADREIPWERVALTEEQAVGLPTKEEVDGRDGKTRNSVECEAPGQAGRFTGRQPPSWTR